MNRLRKHTPFYLTRPARVVAIIAAAVVAALLTGCGNNPSSNHRLIALTDDDGCKYVGVVGDKSAPSLVSAKLDPVIGRDGKQVCALAGAK